MMNDAFFNKGKVTTRDFKNS